MGSSTSEETSTVQKTGKISLGDIELGVLTSRGKGDCFVSDKREECCFHEAAGWIVLCSGLGGWFDTEILGNGAC